MVCVQNCLLSFILLGGILSTMITSKLTKSRTNLTQPLMINKNKKCKKL